VASEPPLCFDKLCTAERVAIASPQRTQAIRFHQEINDVHGQDSIFVIEGRHEILCDDDFLERIPNRLEVSNFLDPLLGIIFAYFTLFH
jgi:hypothetical protein